MLGSAARATGATETAVPSRRAIRYNSSHMERDERDTGTAIEEIPSRPAYLGALAIRRALPVRERRTIGPWCFLDRYGPLSFSEGAPMDALPHPHIGIQTVSWLFDGELEHYDSLGYDSIARPGGVNVMTAGRGIAHAERTPASNSGRLDGVQLWVALPDASRNAPPAFEHAPEVPRLDLGGGQASVFIGSLAGASPGVTAHSPMLGAEIACRPGGTAALDLDRRFEHGIFVAAGAASLGDRLLETNTLYYVPPGRDALELHSLDGARLILLGGEPLASPIVIWWNFVARTREEIAAAREAWESGSGFDPVIGHDGPRVTAPPLARPAQPSPRP
jgi:redox-sensitive bicupin YhaK (pirin superfamily)